MRRQRPWSVTASGGLAVAYGVVSVLGSLVFLSGGSPAAFLFMPFDVWFLVIMLAVLTVGTAFAGAGVGALRGSSTARWVLVGVYGLTAFAALNAAALTLWPRVVGVVNLLALVGLVSARARAWFDA